MSSEADRAYAEFTAWADKVLAGSIPPEVVAFSVNLYEGLETFDVQISGAASFDPSGEEWACEPIFSSEENLFPIPRELVEDRWEGALKMVLGWVKRYLLESTGGSVLRASRGIGVGFVDGDLHLVWP